MPERDDSAIQEIARDLSRVLPLVGCPRWLLWAGVTAGVVLYVVGTRLLPHLAADLWKAIKRIKVEPPPLDVPSDDGPREPGEHGPMLPGDAVNLDTQGTDHG